jgi:putative intracellular protease/amidase
MPGENETRERIMHVLLIDQFADWEAPLALCELARRGGWRTVTIGVERGRVRSMGGLTVEIERAIADVDPASVDAIMVIGSPVWERGEIREISSFLRAVWQAGATIGAICGATVGAGHAGLLEGRRYTSNGPTAVSSLVAAERLGTYVHAPAVGDGRLVTASGLGYVEFAAEMLAAIGAMKDEERAGWVAFLRAAPAA